MGYDTMSAWDRHAFTSGGVWKGQQPFNSHTSCTEIHDDDFSLPSPPTSSHDAPSFAAAKAQWSPPSSPRTRSLRSPSPSSPARSPRMNSARPLDDSPPATQSQDKRVLADQLYAASCAGDLGHIKLLLSLGAPINTPSMIPNLYESFKPAKSGALSALAGAAGNNQLPTVQLLLSAGAALNPTMRQSSSSPLHQACKGDHLDMAAHLLEHGADVNSLNCYKITPLMYAVRYGSAPLVRLILAYEPQLSTLSFVKTAAIHWAVWPGLEDVMELLLQAGADPNQPMGDESTPLHCAAMSGLTAKINVLLAYGADPRKRNAEGKTAVQVAEECGHWETAEVLKLGELRRRTN